jgi:hypothetical protein
MANREYLERLLLLYFEFEEAQLGGFADIHACWKGRRPSTARSRRAWTRI